MIPTRLTLSNFMCYRADGAAEGPPSLLLDGLHVVCLSGENGAGKSALLDAITWALWGEARMADDDLIAQGQSEMSVDLEFQLGDQHYRVIRRRQRGGTGKRGGQTAGKSQVDLQVRGGAGWRPIGENTVRETQAAIDGLLRMSYQTFINASFLLQGRADEFTARTPSERKEVLADILDLGEYEALAEQAKGRAKGFADQLKGLRGRIEQLEQSAQKLPFWASTAQEADAKAAHMGEQVGRAEQAQADADTRLRALEQQADQRKGLLRELESLRGEQAAREGEIATLHGQIAAARALVSRRELIARGVSDLAAARAELDRLDGLRDQHDALARRQAELRQQFSEARGELRRRLSAQEQRRNQLERIALRRESLQAEIHALGEQL
ncbi:MAG: SMC family ATPase, partial [Chloroflexales bacterium]|nr:SMC family ATPase [Chloroflexales bacterium]